MTPGFEEAASMALMSCLACALGIGERHLEDAAPPTLAAHMGAS